MEQPANSLAQSLVLFTERVLTNRVQKKLRRKVRQAKKHPIIDWIEAFLWAAMVVLVVNQYFIQAYQIPSPSMRNTLLEGDRLFVDKFSYGPEILPGLWKTPGIESVSRAQVMCFENPVYESNGPVFMIFQRILYMLTLSLVDIDREGGEPRMYLLIKRAVGAPGDQWRYTQGTFQVRTQGAQWISEGDFKKLNNLHYTTEKDIPPSVYAEKELALQGNIKEQILGEQSNGEGFINEDPYWTGLQFRVQAYKLLPKLGQDQGLTEAINGWYVPKDYILPLGDNRDHSQDGRYFGPIHKQDILGKALFIYWPLNRIGIIK